MNWEKLFDSPIPIDRVARIVTSSAPWWSQPLPDKPKGRRLEIDDFVSIMSPPEDSRLVDYRGRRSRFHIVCGFAHRKHLIAKKYSSGEAAMLAVRQKHGTYIAHRVQHQARRMVGVSCWYVLRVDGAVLLATSEGLRKKLSDFDDKYLRDVSEGYATGGVSLPEWDALDAIPTQPAKNLKTAPASLPLHRAE